jgi:hypothetical protein
MATATAKDTTSSRWFAKAVEAFDWWFNNFVSM